MDLPGSLSRIPHHIQRTDEAGTSGSAGLGNAPAQVCGRASTQVSDFPNTYIERITIDHGRHTDGMEIHWNRRTAETRALPSKFDISPGAGSCSVCCDEEATSRSGGSLCTPKADSEINRYACRLSTTAWARNASFFETKASRAGIAIHSGYNGHVPGFPASHGCVRTSNQGSAVVWDNSSARAIRAEPPPTKVEVSGTWDGNRCYPSEQGDRRSRTRSERCSSGGRTGAVAPEPQPDEDRFAIEGLGARSDPDDLAGPA